MSVSFCLPHPVAVSVFMICRGLCACTEMLWMCVQYITCCIYTAAINDNKIPHVWKLANIISIPKPNKDVNIATSYRPISLLSVIADTREGDSSLHNTEHTKQTHGIHNIPEPHVNKATIQIRSSTRRRPLTHTLQHLYFRHPTTIRLCTTDHIRGRHNYHSTTH